MKFSVVCYNIHSGKNIVYRPSLQNIIGFLLTTQADIVALQEVQNNSKNGWHFSTLQNDLELYAAFGGNIRVADGEYGNAVLSRYPILQWDNHLIPSKKEQRGALSVTIDIDGTPIRILNTHLGLGKQERKSQMEFIDKLIGASEIPCLLMGDFNTINPYPFSDLIDIAVYAGKENMPTIFPLRKRIDYIFASPRFEPLNYSVDEVNYSDHYPIRAVLNLRE